MYILLHLGERNYLVKFTGETCLEQLQFIRGIHFHIYESQKNMYRF